MKYNGLFGPFERNHEIFSLPAEYDMLSHFNIGRSRISMAGFSWGGRLTGEIVPRRPEIFKGGLAIISVDNFEKAIRPLDGTDKRGEVCLPEGKPGKPVRSVFKKSFMPLLSDARNHENRRLFL